MVGEKFDRIDNDKWKRNTRHSASEGRRKPPGKSPGFAKSSSVVGHRHRKKKSSVICFSVLPLEDIKIRSDLELRERGENGNK